VQHIGFKIFAFAVKKMEGNTYQIDRKFGNKDKMEGNTY
jgi:hypothetical protein